MTQQENLLGIVKSIFRYKKFIILTCIVVGAGSAGLSLLLDDYFKASTLFYAAHPDLQNPEKIFGTSTAQTYYYGGDADVDRLISVAKSNELTDYLVSEFGLYDHYEIDQGHPKASFFVKKELLKLYNVQKTKLDAIELSIEDLDPKMASNMANSARKKIDEISSRLVKNSQSSMEAAIIEGIKQKEEQIQDISDTLSILREKYGVYDLRSQPEVIASQLVETENKLFQSRAVYNTLKEQEGVESDTLVYLKARLDGLEKSYKQLTSTKSSSKVNLRKFNDGYNQVYMLTDELDKSQAQLNKDRERLKIMQATKNSTISSIHLIAAAQVPIIKSRPKRSILVVGATLLAFMFCIISVILYDNYKDLQWKEIINGK